MGKKGSLPITISSVSPGTSPKKTQKEAEIQTDTDKHRQAVRQAGQQTGRHASRQADRQTCRQVGRRAGRQADSHAAKKAQQPGRHYRHTERQRCIENNLFCLFKKAHLSVDQFKAIGLSGERRTLYHCAA
jgi:general stress protein YciG